MTTAAVSTDLVLDQFGADLADIVAIARAADAADVGTVWVNDHFSGHVVGAPWSRDPFVCLGAIAAVTEHVEVGLLVANLTNRHPAQLASAINSLQSLAPGRVRLGVGSGAAPGSRFASEHDMIGKRLLDAPGRLHLLRDSILALRDIWADAPSNVPPNRSVDVGFDGLSAVVDGASPPPMIVGASAWSTIDVAIELADGVNIRRTARLGEQLARLRSSDVRPGFEVSVLDRREPGSPIGAIPADLVDAGVDRHIVTVSPVADLAVVRAMAARRPR